MSLSHRLQQLGCMSILGTVANFLSHHHRDEKYSHLIGQLSTFLASWKICTSFPKPKEELRYVHKIDCNII